MADIPEENSEEWGRALTYIARHWSKQTDNGKGLRVEASTLDLLNAIGVGELIQSAAARYQREQSQKRAQESVSGVGRGPTGYPRRRERRQPPR